MIGCDHFQLRNKSHVNISFRALEVKWCIIYSKHFSFALKAEEKLTWLSIPPGGKQQVWYLQTVVVSTNYLEPLKNLSFCTPCKHEQIKCADQWIKLPSILLTSSVIFNLQQQQVIDNFFLTMEMNVISHSFLCCFFLKPFS